MDLFFFVLTNRLQGFFEYLPCCQSRMRRAYFGWRLLKGGLYSTKLHRFSLFLLTDHKGVLNFCHVPQSRMQHIFAGIYSRVALTCDSCAVICSMFSHTCKISVGGLQIFCRYVKIFLKYLLTICSASRHYTDN